MNKYRIHVSSREQSGLVQEAAFSLGYRWHRITGDTTQTRFEEKSFLYMNSNGDDLITTGNQRGYFREHHAEEVTAEHFIYEIACFDQRPQLLHQARELQDMIGKLKEERNKIISKARELRDAA